MPRDYDESKTRPTFETYFPHPAAEPIRIKRSEEFEPPKLSRSGAPIRFLNFKPLLTLRSWYNWFYSIHDDALRTKISSKVRFIIQFVPKPSKSCLVFKLINKFGQSIALKNLLYCLGYQTTIFKEFFFIFVLLIWIDYSYGDLLCDTLQWSFYNEFKKCLNF